MKKFLYLAVMLISLSAAATTKPVPDVAEKVLKAFQQTFSGAQDVTWNETDNNYQANFKMSEIKVRAKYDSEGNLLETVRYYGEKELPLNIIARLKKKYASQEVFGVTEISSENEMTYHIVLKDAKHWYTVKADPYGNLQQTEKFKNASTDK